jgi:hypothetical protein
LGTVKPKLDQIERLDKHIHRADRIILVDPILKALISGNKVACPRSIPSTNRAIRPPADSGSES